MLLPSPIYFRFLFFSFFLFPLFLFLFFSFSPFLPLPQSASLGESPLCPLGTPLTWIQSHQKFIKIVNVWGSADRQSKRTCKRAYIAPTKIIYIAGFSRKDSRTKNIINVRKSELYSIKCFLLL